MFKPMLSVLLLATAVAAVPMGAGRSLLEATPKVELGTAGDFAILTKTGISTIPKSTITGNIGVSPISGAAITGFSETADSSGTFATASQVSGNIYASDYISPTPIKMTTAISDMKTAYNDAAGRAVTDGAKTNFAFGLLGGKTLTPGVYAWNTDVKIDTAMTIKGSPTDIFVFKTSGDVKIAANIAITLEDGAKAENIFWQVAGAVTAGPGAHLEGIFLVATKAVFQTESSLKGRVLAETACTLDAATVTQPVLE
jgi:hypothetical protein